MLGLHGFMAACRLFPSCSKWGLLSLVAGLGCLIAEASLVVDHRLQGACDSAAAACGLTSFGPWALEHRLDSCRTRAQLLCAIWLLPGPGIKPVSPALAGRFLTTEPPGGLRFFFFLHKPFLRLCLICYNIAFIFYILVSQPRGMWDLSFLTRDRTYIPCTGRLSLNHWTSREVLALLVFIVGIKGNYLQEIIFITSINTNIFLLKSRFGLKCNM